MHWYAGIKIESYPDGRVVTIMLEGTVITAYSDGTKVQEKGSVKVTLFANGSKKQIDSKTGISIVTRADGTRVQKSKDSM